MRFLKSRLSETEKVMLVGKANNIVFLPGLLSLIVFLLLLKFNVGLAMGFFLFGAYYLIKYSGIQINNEYVVTDKRVLVKHGSNLAAILELPHDKVLKVAVEQGFFGQVFNYGNLIIYGRNPQDQMRVEFMCDPVEIRNKTILILDKIYDT